ncbi:MAG: TIGR01212 family radical SAM protein [Eubacteriales bacterium]|nr:TIGR01212 family radical SAM protein [Eubacteriales bacterium]
MYINRISDEYKRVFSCKVYKLAIDGGFSCPNRDGTCGVGGCTFCSSQGSGEFAARGTDISEQIEKAKMLVAQKAKSAKFIAYFQSFSNTYAPKEILKVKFEQASKRSDIAALCIATRPDCLPEDTLELLSDINRDKPVYIELGLQTIHEATARAINRGYPIDAYDRAVDELKKRNIYTVTHMIIGLPGETEEMIYETARYIGESGVQGIKLHSLYILSDAAIKEDYYEGKVKVLSMDEYIRLLAGCIERLPESLVIHRLTGDPPKAKLIAPRWSADKKRVLNSINRYLSDNDVTQGSRLQIFQI